MKTLPFKTCFGPPPSRMLTLLYAEHALGISSYNGIVFNEEIWQSNEYMCLVAELIGEGGDTVTCIIGYPQVPSLRIRTYTSTCTEAAPMSTTMLGKTEVRTPDKDHRPPFSIPSIVYRPLASCSVPT